MDDRQIMIEMRILKAMQAFNMRSFLKKIIRGIFAFENDRWNYNYIDLIYSEIEFIRLYVTMVYNKDFTTTTIATKDFIFIYSHDITSMSNTTPG